jgi:two-component system, LuxR family, response regulator FixJ
MSEEPRVYIVDDDPVARDSVRWLVESVGLQAATYEGAQDFLDAFDPHQHGCLVLDVRLKGMSGFELLECLRTAHTTPPTVMITGYADFSTAVRAMKGGVVDILEKPFSEQGLLDSIWHAIDIDRKKRVEDAERAGLEELFGRLTPRKREVLDLIVEGLTSKEIAAQLGLSVRTVEGYRGQLLCRMGVDSVAKLVQLALTLRPRHH